MIQNEHQYQITQIKLKEFEQELAAIAPPLGSLLCLGSPDSTTPQDPNLHPRQIVGWTNSYNLTIRQLKQEIAAYNRINSGNI
jgi:hypothetical protein